MMTTMTTTFLLSQFWGILFVTLGVILLLKKDLVVEIMENVRDQKYSVLAGFISLILGIVTWLLSGRGEILMKFIALASFLKGISLLAYPQWRYRTLKPLENKKGLINILLIITIVIGLYLIFNDANGSFGMRHWRMF
jgi:hypothetical protein